MKLQDKVNAALAEQLERAEADLGDTPKTQSRNPAQLLNDVQRTPDGEWWLSAQDILALVRHVKHETLEEATQWLTKHVGAEHNWEALREIESRS